MTAADKLRELLATRPAMPNTEQLVSWWRTSAELVPQVLAELDVVKQEIRELEQQRDSLRTVESAVPADDESRCAVCGWSMNGWPTAWGCKPGDCSLRPPPEKLYAPERAKREAEELHERAVLAGMPPSGRWA